LLIERRTRACWHYVLSKNSDLPAIMQHELSSLQYLPLHRKQQQAMPTVNDYLEERKRPQRLHILYTDGAGESSSDDVEEFLADLNIHLLH